MLRPASAWVESNPAGTDEEGWVNRETGEFLTREEMRLLQQAIHDPSATLLGDPDESTTWISCINPAEAVC